MRILTGNDRFVADEDLVECRLPVDDVQKVTTVIDAMGSAMNTSAIRATTKRGRETATAGFSPRR